MNSAELLATAKKVLKRNDRNLWTVPAGDLYPHQWLWDSCFIAIGRRHYDVHRAQVELRSLLRGQWRNGMLPDIIFSKRQKFSVDELLWDSNANPDASKSVSTSGVSQPPILAEAVWKVGEKLNDQDRSAWFREMLPALVKFHGWLYTERDPQHEGLITLVHPYESGLDNSPPWIEELKIRGIPGWVKLGHKLGLGLVINLLRRDTRHAKDNQRMSDQEALAFFIALRRLHRQKYQADKIFQKPYLAVQDLAFNCILIRANQWLVEIAKAAGRELPEALAGNMEKSRTGLEKLWDEATQQYYSRSYSREQLIIEPSVATLLPLYAGCIDESRARLLVKLIKDDGRFATNWPLPSVPLDSKYFNPSRYWQGPTWVNMNWLIIEGLRQYEYFDEAKALRERTLELVAKSGCSEYYNPLTGEAEGADNFSWTAALTIDLLNN